MKWLHIVALISFAAVGCAASSDEQTDDASGAATEAEASSDITSLGGGVWIDYQLAFDGPFDPTMLVPVGITKTPRGAQENALGYRLTPPARGTYTLTVENRSSDTEALDGRRGFIKLPKNVISDAIGRIAILALRDGEPARVILSASPQNLSMFEKVKVGGGDMVYFETTTIAGEHLTGPIDLPGLTSGETQYAITVTPRNRPSGGSLVGAHLFAIKATCSEAGCIDDPFAAAAP